MRPALLATVLLAAALGPGCFGECPPALTARWDEPGLYDALPAGARHAGLALAEGSLPQGMPVHDPAFAARWPRFAVTTALWRPAQVSDGASDDAFVDASRITLTQPAGTANGTVLDRAHATLADVGLSPDAAWDDALLRSRSGSGFAMGADGKPVVIAETFQAGLPGSPDLDPLVARLGLGNATVEPAGAGHVGVRWAQWRLDVALPVRSLDLTHNGTTLHLQVDADDHVTASLPVESPASWRGPLADATREGWARMGLAAPQLKDLSGGVMVC